MRYDLVVENLEAADEILFRLLENSLNIEDKRDLMLKDISRIKSLIRKAELFLKDDESEQPKPPISQTPMLGEVHDPVDETFCAMDLVHFARWCITNGIVTDKVSPNDINKWLDSIKERP